MRSRALSLGLATAVLTMAGWRAAPGAAAESDLRATVDLLKKRVDQLEATLASREREASLQPSRVKAPFEVVDRTGKLIFVVTDDRYNWVPDQGRVTVSRGRADNFVMTFHRPAGQIALALGEAAAPTPGAGVVSVNDPAGITRVELHGAEGVDTFSPTGKDVISLGFDAKTHERGVVHLHGLMQIFDAGGRTTVEAGTQEDGVGVVRVGPNFVCSGYGGVRAPDCIKGRP